MRVNCLRKTGAAAVCMWTHPGRAPWGRTFTKYEEAVKAYRLAPAEEGDILDKIRDMVPDAVVLIGPNSIDSMYGQATNLRDMHWRRGMCKGPVDRSKWLDTHREVALVFCGPTECVAIPPLCGNVARIDFVPRTDIPVTPPSARGLPPEWRVPHGRVGTIPEPSVLPLVGIALVSAWLMSNLVSRRSSEAKTDALIPKRRRRRRYDLYGTSKGV